MKMRNIKNKNVVEVEEHIIIENLWEYYIISNDNNSKDIKFALVLGYEQEFGDVSLSEIEPHIITRTRDFKDVMPAPGFEWVS